MNTGEMTTKQRLALKKIEKAKKRQRQLNEHSVSEYQANKTIVKAVKNRNEGTQEGGFGLKTQKVQGQMMVHNTNKVMSELRFKKRNPKESVMEKAQDIDLDAIFNTIHNVKVKDVDNEFQEVPGNSSYVPIPASQQERPIKKAVQKEQEIEEEID